MSTGSSAPEGRPGEDETIRRILEGTAAETGERFFEALVANVAAALGTHGAWVTEYLAEERRLRSFAFWLGGEWVRDYEYDIAGTPCEPVVCEARPVHVPDNVISLYPRDPDLRAAGAVSYYGIPLVDEGSRVLGHLAVLHTRPLLKDPRAEAVLRIFAARAAAELLRLRAGAALRAGEERLRGLVDSALDSIVELDPGLRVVRLNPAAARLFQCDPAAAGSIDLDRLLRPRDRERIAALASELAGAPPGGPGLWIAGRLEARRGDGGSVPVEGTLSSFAAGRSRHLTLIVRDVRDRLEAERLRAELQAIEGDPEIVGRSPALARVLEDVRSVAPTDATVLVLGETGTGKGLVARAVHAASRRRDRPLVRVNCGALPAALIESELFGHEKGAFTGATARREGRFALADEGTLFLDEIGELAMDLQVKLLRVLQEGEIEPVGSSETRRVDVRVIAATHRDLPREIEKGRFREDLYYRLNVFPIHVPPLRERKEDIASLAAVLIERCAGKLGRRVGALTPGDVERLQAYEWPGNVRELGNVIERAVITSDDGRLNLDRALLSTSSIAAPRPEPRTAQGAAAAPGDGPALRVRTARELEELERANYVQALEASRGRIAGAARLLGMKPSTLRSRLKALGVPRPE